ncbi:hypothetical protein [Nocardia beijingensis]|uniref:hypothetical protein n=1 Tax=Nocardia beijingensis TaxID=95162 RepID=UPI00397FF219
MRSGVGAARGRHRDGWKQAAAAVVVSVPAAKDDPRRCWELGATLAAGLMP